MENNLKTIRTKSGLSLQILGDMCGRSKAQIYQLEKATSYPRLDTAYRVGQVLNVSVYEIWPDMTEIMEETITIRRVVDSSPYKT